MTGSRLRLAVSVLLVVAAALFAVGVAVERHETRTERTTTEQHEPAGGHHEEGGEEAPARAAERHGERVFGINTESTALVTAAVAVALALAVGLWLSPSRMVPAAVASFALVSAAFDVREILHQLDESHSDLVAIASTVAALHIAVVAGSIALALADRSRIRSPD